MKFAIVEYKKNNKKFFRKTITIEELSFEDKSFYYIRILRKNVNEYLSKKEINKLKKLLSKLDIEEIICKANKKVLYSLEDNDIKLLDCRDYFVDILPNVLAKIMKETDFSPKKAKVFIYDPFLKYSKEIIYKISELVSVIKVFTFKIPEMKEISNDIMENTGACVLYTDYMEKIEDYNFIIITSNIKGFFSDREISKNSVVFSREKEKRNRGYNVIDTVNIGLPKEMTEFEKFDCNFELVRGFLKYNYLKSYEPEILSLSGYNKLFSFSELKDMLNKS